MATVRLRVFRAIVTLAIVIPPPALAQEREVPTFGTEARLVTVDAIVLDHDGNPVRGLQAGDFAVSEDGVPQEIASFESIDLGALPISELSGSRFTSGPVASNERPVGGYASSFILLVDDMGLTPARAPDVQRAIERFVSEGLRDGDDLLFATTSGDTWWNARMPEGAEDVRALTARLRGRKLSETIADYMSEWEAYRVSRIESPTGASLESFGIPVTTEDSGIAIAAPTTSVTERIVTRWLESRVCDPQALGLCRTMIARRAEQIDQARVNRTRDVAARVDRAVFALSAHRGRKALLLITEGFLNDPDVDVARVVSGRCREANIAIYSIDARGLVSGLEDLGPAMRAYAPNSAELALMQQEQVEFQAAGTVALAEDTGGVALRTNDLGGGAVRIAEESRVYYLLGIVPPAGKGPRAWRALEVTVKRPGLTVRARKGYTLRNAAQIQEADLQKQAEASARAAAEKGTPEVRPLEVSRALANGLDRDEIPIRAMPFLFGPGPEGRVHGLVALEADLSRIADLGGDEHPVTVLSLGIAVAHRDSGDVQHVDQKIKVDSGRHGAALRGWLTLRREFDFRPGVNQARVVLRDGFLGRTGAVTARFVVPEPEGLRISTPILTDRTLSRPGEAPHPAFLARRVFGTSGTLYCQFEVYGAKAAAGEAGPRVETSWQLRRVGGSVVRQRSASGPAVALEGRVVALEALALDGLRPGDYELRLTAYDRVSGASVERLDPIRLE